MKSYEKHLYESCPAVFEWHKLAWEKELMGEKSPDILSSNEEDVIEECILPEVTEEKPIIKEWQTINGKRKIDQSFANNMIIGY